MLASFGLFWTTLLGEMDADSDGKVSASRDFYLSDDPDAVGNWLFGDIG